MRVSGALPVVLLAILSLVGAEPASARSVRYRVLDIGLVPGTSSSRAYAHNSKGRVVGSSGDGSSRVACIWDETNRLREISGLAALGLSDASCVSESGYVIGSCQTANGGEAFAWDEGEGLTLLGHLSGDTGSGATSVNEAGVVVGNSHNSDTGTSQAVQWNMAGNMGSLGFLPGCNKSGAASINNAGAVVGSSWLEEVGLPRQPDRSFIWHEATGMEQIPTLSGYASMNAYCINDREEVVGSAWGPVEFEAFVYSKDAGTLSIGFLPDHNYSFAYAINNSGHVVGGSGNSIPGHAPHSAFLYTNGTMTDLNDLIDPASGWWLTDGRDIDDTGGICGLGLLNGEHHGFYLVPVPETSGLITVLLGAIAVLWERRASRYGGR